MSITRTLIPLSALLILVALLGACPGQGGDDDDSVLPDDDDAVADDDDVAPDDDDSATPDDDDVAPDDDDVADDDDSAVVGCPDAALEAALAAVYTWPRLTTCASAAFYTGQADEDVRLATEFDIDSDPVVGHSYTIVLGDEMDTKDEVPGTLVVQQGTHLMEYDCNDAISVEPVVDREWQGFAGTATLVVTALNGMAGWQADVTLTGVQVRATDDPSAVCEVPDTTWSALAFGWLPG